MRKKMPIRRALFSASTAALLLAVTATPGASANALVPHFTQLAQAESLSLNEAAKMVQQRVGGRILAAEVAQSNGRTYYLIRILVRKGQVKVYRVDPHSGRIF